MTTNARIILRLLAGILVFPILIALLIALLSLATAMSLVISVPGLTLWLLFVLPTTFLYGCGVFALEDSLYGFKYIKKSFIAMVDPIGGFTEVIIPTTTEIYNTTLDLVRMALVSIAKVCKAQHKSKVEEDIVSYKKA